MVLTESNVSCRSVGCPLLLFWPLVREARGSRGGGRACGDKGEDAVMEMRLRENPQQFSSALLQLSARYLFVQGAQVRSRRVPSGRRTPSTTVSQHVCVCVHRSLPQCVLLLSSGDTSWCGRCSHQSKPTVRKCFQIRNSRCQPLFSSPFCFSG